MKRFTQLTATALIATMALIGPAGAATIPLNLDDFAANLKRELHGKAVGYSFAIFQDGQMVRSGAGGKARTAGDTPLDFSVETRIDIGSCTKFISALTLLKELERQPQVSRKSPIYPYLPKGWAIHPSVKTITFEEILSHTSGLRQVGAPSRTPGKINEVIKDTLKQGVVDRKYSYENVNFALCRILVPYLHDRPAMEKLEGDVQQHERGTAECFINLARQYVFRPAGLGTKIAANTWDKDVRPETLFYNFASPTNGKPNEDSTLVIGAGGWWMNARELAAVCSALDRGQIVGSATRGFMEAGNLGFYRTTGAHGDYFWHNGEGPGNATAHADFMLFPNGVQMALALNSANNQIQTYGEAAYKGMIKKAFDDACLQSDLQIQTFAATGPAKYVGNYLEVPFRLIVRNHGPGDTDSHFVNAVYHGDQVVWTGMMAELKAGQSKVVEGIARIPDRRQLLKNQLVPLSARADARIQAADTSVPDWAFVKESNEANNTSRELQVPGPGSPGPAGGGLSGVSPSHP